MDVMTDQQLRKARHLARSGSWRECPCETCRGKVRAVLDPINSGAAVACPNCAGDGVIWYEGDPRAKVGRLDTREFLTRLDSA